MGALVLCRQMLGDTAATVVLVWGILVEGGEGGGGNNGVDAVAMLGFQLQETRTSPPRLVCTNVGARAGTDVLQRKTGAAVA